MNLYFETRSTYGMDRIYPSDCSALANQLCEFAGRKTLDKYHLIKLIMMGYTVCMDGDKFYNKDNHLELLKHGLK